MQAARWGIITQIQAAEPHKEELSWLKRCLLAEAKNRDLLNDLSSLLEGVGFLNLKVKYVGGLRVLLECPSIEAAQKTLINGSPYDSSPYDSDAVKST